MVQRWQKMVVAASVLVAASCGSDSAEPLAESATDEQRTNDGTATAQSSGPSADDPSVARAIELAGLLIDQLGSDDLAVSAVLRAGDAGYDIFQIEAAIVGATLNLDGSVEGVTPTFAPADLVVGFRAKPATADQDPVPIEKLRDGANGVAGDEDVWPTGTLATSWILSMHLMGYSQAQIVNMLILGAEDLEGGYAGEIEEGEEHCGGLVIGGKHEIPDFCDPETGELFTDAEDEPADTETSEDSSPQEGDGEVEAAIYGVSRVPQLETYSIEVAGGRLSVSSSDGELLVTGQLVFDKVLWGTGTEPLCYSTHTVAVEATTPIAEEMSFRLPATSAIGLELISTGSSGNGREYCDAKNGVWLRDAESNEEWFVEEYGGPFVVVTVDDGELVGCVVYSGEVCPNNLLRAD